MVDVPDEAYGRLLALRTGLRRFLRWSEQQARAAGLTPAQHQLLLAIRGHPDRRGPTIGEVADYLLLRHHSVIGLVDRAAEAGFVTRTRDRGDQRVVRLRLTRLGARRLAALSALHLEELKRLAPTLPSAWEDLTPDQPAHGLPGPQRGASAGRRARRGAVTVARVYDHVAEGRADRVLVDRLWPRGIGKDDAPFDRWCKDVAPSTELRRWYGHDPGRFAEFARRYRAELSVGPAAAAAATLEAAARSKGVVLLTATRDVDHSGAAVLGEVLTDE